MSFPRAKLQRFNEGLNSVPSPGKYNPQYDSTLKASKNKRLLQTKETFDSPNWDAGSCCSFTTDFRTPQVSKVRRGSSPRSAMELRQIVPRSKSESTTRKRLEDSFPCASDFDHIEKSTRVDNFTLKERDKEIYSLYCSITDLRKKLENIETVKNNELVNVKQKYESKLNNLKEELYLVREKLNKDKENHDNIEGYNLKKQFLDEHIKNNLQLSLKEIEEKYTMLNEKYKKYVKTADEKLVSLLSKIEDKQNKIEELERSLAKQKESLVKVLNILEKTKTSLDIKEQECEKLEKVKIENEIYVEELRSQLAIEQEQVLELAKNLQTAQSHQTCTKLQHNLQNEILYIKHQYESSIAEMKQSLQDKVEKCETTENAKYESERYIEELISQLTLEKEKCSELFIKNQNYSGIQIDLQKENNFIKEEFKMSSEQMKHSFEAKARECQALKKAKCESEKHIKGLISQLTLEKSECTHLNIQNENFNKRQIELQKEIEVLKQKFMVSSTSLENKIEECQILKKSKLEREEKYDKEFDYQMSVEREQNSPVMESSAQLESDKSQNHLTNKSLDRLKKEVEQLLHRLKTAESELCKAAKHEQNRENQIQELQFKIAEMEGEIYNEAKKTNELEEENIKMKADIKTLLEEKEKLTVEIEENLVLVNQKITDTEVQNQDLKQHNEKIKSENLSQELDRFAVEDEQLSACHSLDDYTDNSASPGIAKGKKAKLNFFHMLKNFRRLLKQKVTYSDKLFRENKRLHRENDGLRQTLSNLNQIGSN